MTRNSRTMIAATLLTAIGAFFATNAFTEQGSVMSPAQAPSAFGLGRLNATLSGMSDRLDFRLERLETMLAAMQTAFETMLSEMQDAWDTMNDSILELADDIGEMADRILLMAEEIGEMADRIVATMELMSQTLIELTKILSDCQGSGSVAGGAAAKVAAGLTGSPTLILSPSEGDTLTAGAAFQLAGGYDDFVLYASSDAGMAKPTNVLVQDNDLGDAIARIKAYLTGGKIYLAAKAVDGGAVGELSNTVMVYVP